MGVPATITGPRAHHFVPQCWLAGFTETGKKDGRLFVTDLKRRKQWPTSPPNAGHIRDFYRVTDPALDPLFFENVFGEYESSLGPIFKSLFESPRPPNDEELGAILHFIAIQHIRTPAFRPWLRNLSDEIYRKKIIQVVESREAWEAWLRKADPMGNPGADYERMLKFRDEVLLPRAYELRVENEFYLVKGYQLAMETVLPLLADRYWGAMPSPKGRFIASDAPVSLEGPRGVKVGFQSAEFIFFPVNRFMMLIGTQKKVPRPQATFKRITHQNTFTMLTANEQVYSHVPDFWWQDEHGNDQNDWHGFSKDSILQSVVA